MPSRAGSPNKPKRALLALLQEKFPGYHPVVEMAKTANDPTVSKKERFDANKEVAKYVTPALKAVEVSGADGEPLRIVSEKALTLEEWEKQNSGE